MICICLVKILTVCTLHYASSFPEPILVRKAQSTSLRPTVLTRSDLHSIPTVL